MQIDITMTCTKRLSIFKKTIESFYDNMFKAFIEDNWVRFIVNIDPAGNEGGFNDFVEVLSTVPNISVMIKSPKEASFPKAFKHVWENAFSEYIFHLEDDWELLRTVDLSKLIGILEEEKDLALLRLPMFHAGEESMKNWNKFFPYNGKYYECPDDLRTSLGFCGHPSLIKGEFVRNIVKHLDENRNPEKQFHSRGRTPIMQEVAKWRYGVYGIPGETPLIRDIGRRWMVQNGLRKQGCKAFFVNWEEAK